MAGDSGKRRPEASEEAGSDSGRVPELLRRLMGAGLSGFFVTEEAVRRALGDTMPKEWVDFAVDQSERARREFAERLSGEIARGMHGVDWADLAERLLAGHDVEIQAKVRFVPREEDSRSGSPSRKTRS